MNSILHLAISLFTACLLSACGGDSSVNPEPVPEPEVPSITENKEADFKVLVYIDNASVKGHLGGSERMVTTRLNTLFRQVSNYWNECSKGKLKYSYRYTMSEMIVYEGSSSDQTLRKKIYDDPMDFNKHDVVVFFDCTQDNGETGNGGAACGGGKDHRSVITVFANKEPKDIFNDGSTYQTLVHELGHYRGITDLYQYIIGAKDNPVNNQAYEGPINCVMNWAAAGVWSDYAVKCLNRSGDVKQIGKVFPDFFGDMYPKKMEFTVSVGGQPKRGINIKLYGSRAGGSNRNRDIWTEAFITGQTNSDGKFALVDMKKYFIPSRSEFTNLPADLPYGRWFGFLAEIVSGSSKKYVWIPEYEVQFPFFDNEDTYKVNIEF